MLKSLRERAEMSQEKLSQIVGVDRATISRYEDGTRNPSLNVLQKLAAALNCTIDELVNGEEKQN